MDENKKSYYAIIPANVRYDKSICANAKLLYGEITALTNEKGYCWASNSYFAKLYSVKEETISRWISQLLKHNYVSVQYERRGCEITNRMIIISSDCINNQSSNDEIINRRIDEKVKENITSINNKTDNSVSGKPLPSEFAIQLSTLTLQTSINNGYKQSYTKKQVAEGAITIDRIVSSLTKMKPRPLSEIDARKQVESVVKWGISQTEVENGFCWAKQIQSCAGLTKKSKANGFRKYDNLYSAWVSKKKEVSGTKYREL